MLKTLKNIGRAVIPRSIFKALQPYWHGGIALLANAYFGNPSKDIKVIGVTGTNGKSTTVNLISAILGEAGHKTGLISTVNFKVSDTEKLNDMKMTTPSGWLMQKWLREMVRNNFEYVVLEISSQGLEQNRHLGINFDVAVFTNLTPEHIEAHGGFDQYKKAKGLLFAALKQNHTGRPTAIVANADDDHFEYFINFPATIHISFGIKNESANLLATNVEATPNGVSFQLQNTQFKLQLKGQFDVYNALAASAVAQSQNISLETCKTALEKIAVVAGRMEIIQDQPFTVLIDYAPEPYSLQALYDTIAQWPKKRIIHVLGSTGGGRDRARRHTLGQMAGKTAGVVIVTNEDPYDDNPQEIINEVASGAFEQGKVIGENLFAILDRREAIAFAVKQAKPGDLVLITGKGSEQKMAVAHGNYIDWDDRAVVREELAKL
ncbi:MAG: UDP-N-acetylmuramoyl-L-alanyl-D-glutamate--2,6-diaminopimelate ligase [Candidatus Doudnabacteria bacterium]|nr:UDP-N-acetylmuramoyl-L-alanyl-D-glutamate--2,6-diaminopimelate ligase [Candidatus Doudnabacteria bacterium]